METGKAPAEPRTRQAAAVAASSATDAVDAARADLYTLFALCLGAAPDARLLALVGGLSGGDGPVGQACAALAQAARATDAESAARTHFDLFVGVGRGELLPYASYYLTGFLNERPLAAVRADMARLGLERAEGLFEPEDHVAILCGIMAGFARGAHLAAGCASEAQFFAAHLAPWAGRFFDDLSRARAGGFHAALGALGATFMALEAEAFAIERAATMTGRTA